jgi:hypothetical protein
MWFGDSTVRSIEIQSPRFQTRDSMKVGMPAGRLLEIPQLHGEAAEGPFRLWSDDPKFCRLVFLPDRLTGNGLGLITRRTLTKSDVSPYATTGWIRSISVMRCGDSGPV